MKNILKGIIILLIGFYKTQAQNVLDHQITANTPYLGQYASVKLTIDDANGDNEITHPLIVAEGFDLGVVIAPENEYGYQDYSDFQRSVLNSGSFDLQNLVLNSGKDYDIIYVDWNNGIDYLQRNAYALEAVIAWVNQQKASVGSTEQNVILGQSMGGVIARWALADMEERGLTHDTRLFISHDAPQQGANIPASLQFMYRHGGNQYVQTGQTLGGAIVTVPLLELTVGVSNYLSLLDTPATKQLLKSTATTSYAMVNTDHNTFYNNLKNKGLSGSGGYPINSRNIALSNGSECGNTQDFLAGDHLVNYQWNKGLSFWGDLASLIYNPLGGFFGGFFVDNDLFGVAVLGLIPGHSRYNVDFQAKAIPYGSGNQIYKGLISYTKKILWFIPVTVNITNVQKNQPTGILPFDIYGGGFYNVNQFIDTSTLPSGVFIRDKFSFISTASALDIGKNNITLNDADYLKSYVGASPPNAPKNSPFDNYSTEFDNANPNAGNFNHISFNTRNGNWLAAELVGSNIQFTDCSFICSDTEIVGNDMLCSTRTYSILGGGSSYNWTITSGSNLATISGNGTNTITLTRNTGGFGGYNGALALSVTASNSDCGSNTITKTIWVGNPSFPQLTTSSGVPYDEFNLPAGCANGVTYWEFKTLNALDQTLQFQFSVLGGSIITKNATNGKATITAQELGMLEGMTLDVTVRPVNSCGSNFLVPKFNLYRPTDCECGIGINCNLNRVAAPEDRYYLYPNPVSEVINIVPVFSDSVTTTKSKIIATLYNMLGEKRKRVVINNNNTSMDVQDLKAGMYIMRIQIDEAIETHLIAIN